MHGRCKIPDDVWEAAKAEYHCVIGRTSRDDVTPIRCDGRVVGFYHPHESGYGWRIAPLFVLPQYRRRGLVLAVYAQIDKPLVACIRDDNYQSIKLHEKAGFRKWRRYAAGWWWRREAVENAD